MSKDGNIRAGRPFVFEEGGAVSLEGVPVAPEASSEHFVKYDVLAVGPYNLMIGKDQHGEIAFFRAMEQGNELRRG